ncbi:MAG: hypothetical protein IT422_07155 [Pirellulaceae bacterium]|nr:hypothetical protein [Pirellulaceae bacterium]
MRGIPSHGGGKRFFVEQELISGSARAAAQCVDVSALRGKRCAMFITTVGDQGGGNLVGGRYEWQAALRGDYVTNPTTNTRNSGVGGNSLTVTRDAAGNLLQTIESNSPLIFPSNSSSQQEGYQAGAGGGVRSNGLGEYQATGFLNDDNSYLSAVIRESLVLKGVLLTTPDDAEIFIYITVDAFGTNRSRTEMHLFNQERLIAKTALHVTAFDRKGRVALPTQTSCWEADYRERYVLWCGPFEIEKRAYQSDDLLVSFRGLSDMAEMAPYEAEKDSQDSAEAEKSSRTRMDLPQEESRQPNLRGDDATRPNSLLQELPRPDPTRPEDVNQFRGQ